MDVHGEYRKHHAANGVQHTHASKRCYEERDKGEKTQEAVYPVSGFWDMVRVFLINGTSE